MSLVKNIILVLACLISNIALAIPLIPGGLSPELINNAMKPLGFSDANYPYFENVNGCGPSRSGPIVTEERVPDSYLRKVFFTEVCNSHDRCYMDLSQSKARCDSVWREGLEKACKKQLPLLDMPIHYPLCMADVAGYYTIVSNAMDDWNWARTRQKEFEINLVNYFVAYESFIQYGKSLYLEYHHRSATEAELAWIRDRFFENTTNENLRNSILQPIVNSINQAYQNSIGRNPSNEELMTDLAAIKNGESIDELKARIVVPVIIAILVGSIV
ncbi:MAG: hypothetical protein HQK51_13445 [Oligoflexia bacterium]|nr:hypothetical protein [Oligoflexia bacterium]